MENIDSTTLTWIVVAIVALLLLALLAWFLARRSSAAREEQRREAQREESAELRRKAEYDRISMQEREASAQKLDAEARMSQAEADRKAAEAAQLQQEAQERSAKVGEDRAQFEEHRRRADVLDPDVDTRPGAAGGATSGTVTFPEDEGEPSGPGRTSEHRGDVSPDAPHRDDEAGPRGRHRG
jgi:FtsZ-interacting cell division protein ZipA